MKNLRRVYNKTNKTNKISSFGTYTFQNIYISRKKFGPFLKHDEKTYFKMLDLNSNENFSFPFNEEMYDDFLLTRKKGLFFFFTKNLINELKKDIIQGASKYYKYLKEFVEYALKKKIAEMFHSSLTFSTKNKFFDDIEKHLNKTFDNPEFNLEVMEEFKSKISAGHELPIFGKETFITK